MLVTKNEEQIPEMEWLLIFQINLIAIMAMGRLYEYMAEKLTVWGEFKVYDVWSTYLIESTGWVFLSLLWHFHHPNEANKIDFEDVSSSPC